MITVKEIARMAGVSAKTAERALSGVTKDKRSDAKARAEKVRRIAAEYGWQPSEAALTLRRGSSRMIGFMADVLTDQFLAAAAECAMDAAAAANYRIALQLTRFSPEQTENALKTLLATKVDGIITSCTSQQLPRDLMVNIKKRNVPFFSLCGQNSYATSASVPDYRKSLPEAVRHLAEKGHRKTVCCLFKGKDIDNEISREIFEASCREYGIEPEFRVNTGHSQAALLAQENPESVILFGKYSMRVYMDECAKLGNLPSTIGIYNEWTFASAQNFPLTGIIMENATASVTGAVKQLLSEIENDSAPQVLRIPTSFIPAEKIRQLQVINLANQRFKGLE